VGNPDDRRDDPRARLAALERRLDALRDELEEVRREIDPRSGETLFAPPPPRAAPPLVDGPVRAAPTQTKPHVSLEVLVGRYGMLALAAVLVLAAAGMFLSWAAGKGWLGPSVRLALGLAGAAALAVWGIRVRPRHRPFGDALLGIALATAHVCAWAAGPALRLVPAPVALAFSAVASVVLAAFALRERDEPLWCIGFGGAALAPFVTSTGQGTAPMLAGYAAAVLVAGGSALGAREWRIGGRVFGAAAALFVLALGILPVVQHGPWLALALPFVAAIGGTLPFAQGDTLRPRLRTLGLLGVLAAFRCVAVPFLPALASTAIFAAAGIAWLVLLDRADTDPPGLLLDGFGEAPSGLCDWVDGAVLPGGFLAVLLVSLEGNPAGAGAATGLAAGLLLATAARRPESPLRDALAAVAWAAAVTATLIELRDSPLAATAAVAWVSVLAALIGRAVPSLTWRWAPLVSLAGASAWALGLVTLRPSYQYVPFATRESAAAFAIALAWVVAIRLARRSDARAAAFIFVFLWFHQELAFAIGPSASTLLLVTYYAVCSVASVGVGRARDLIRLRQIGLALALAASALAIHGAFQLALTGARIGACLVASAFLLGIAWWYRKPAAHAESAGLQPPG
jgi:hypothetical protein